MSAALRTTATAAYLALSAQLGMAAGTCSPHIGAASLNEYNHLDDFVEVKLINKAVDTSGWRVRLYRGPGVYTERSLPASSGNTCGAYHVFDFAPNQTPPDADLVLLDANNDVIDLMRARTSFPITSSFYTPYPICGFLSPPIDVQSTSSQKGLDRVPDGIGPWRATPGTGAGSLTTRCGANPEDGAATDLQVTKAASASTVTVGQNVSFTVQVHNLGPATAVSVVVAEALPSALTYVSHTASAGTYSTSSGLWSIASLAVGATQTLTLVATANTAGSTTNSVSASSNNPDPNSANNSASVVIVGQSASTSTRFNAVDVAGDGLTGKIHTKIAGQAFNLDVVALNALGSALDSGFNGSVQVEIVGNAALGVAVGPNNCPASASVLGTQTVSISGGRATIAVPALAEAWRDVRVRITYNATTPATQVCSRDNFAVRPSSLAPLTITDADWATAGTSRSLNNVTAVGGNVHRAGRPFQMSAAARNAAGSVTSNYAGSPAALLTPCSGSACPATLGTLTLSATAAGGLLSTSSATYTEVGAFDLQLQDQDFSQVDLGDGTSLDCSGAYLCSAVTAVGRFVPDSFVLTPTVTPVLKTFNDDTCAVRSFTYIGQPFGYLTAPAALVQARNATGATTVNYQGALWHASATATYSSAPSNLDTTATSTPALSAGTGGTGTVTINATDLLSYTRSVNTPQTPFNANITLTLSASDASDSLVAGNGVITTSLPAVFDGGGTGIAFDSGSQFRYGVLHLSNALGSELLDLPVPVEARYWNGTGFVVNAADSCTQISAGNIVMNAYALNLNACETAGTLSGRLSSGRKSLQLTRPGTGNSGSVNLTLRLSSVATGDSTCLAPIPTSPQPVTPANRAFLGSAHCTAPSSCTYTADPAAKAAFGVRRSASEVIYLRELY